VYADRSRAELIGIIEGKDQTIEVQRTTITTLEAKVAALDYRLTQMQRRLFGTCNDEVPGQVRMDLAELGLEDVAEIEAEEDRAADAVDDDRAAQAPPAESRRGRGKRGGRLRIPDHIPHEDVILEPDPTTLFDEYGRPLIKLRENISLRLEHIPGHFIAQRIIRPVYGRRDDDDVREVAAPAPPQIVAGGLAGDSILATLLCDKFDLHNPYYRQQDRFARAGIALPRSSMVNWVGALTEFLSPVVRAVEAEVRAAPFLALDDTTLQRLAPGTGRTHTGRLWGFLGGGAVAIRYADTRAGSHAEAFLDGWTGPVVADHYVGHEALYQRGCRHVPCWAHVRRKFVDAARDGGDERAAIAIALIGKLYEIEQDQRDRPPDQRQRVRQRRAPPIIDRFLAELDHLAPQTTPKSPLGQAVRYAHNLRDRLRAYLDDGRLPIDNNALERLWKPVALGRKNYLFVGNQAGGERAAAAYTLMLSCRLAEVEPYAYLMATIAALHAGERDHARWTPQAYAARRAAAARHAHSGAA